MMYRLRLVCVFTFMLVSAVALPQRAVFQAHAATRTARTSAFVDGTYRIASQASGKLLDVAAAALNVGGGIIQWHDVGGANQHWQVARQTDGTYELIAQHSQLALDVPGRSTDDSLQLQQYAPNGTPAQRFRIEAASADSYQIVNVHSNKCVDVRGGSTTDGTPVQQYACNDTVAQHWQFLPLVTTSPTLPPTAPGTSHRLSLAEYRALAASLSSDAGIAYRYGAASTVSNDGFPTYWEPEHKWLNRDPFPGNYYEIGTVDKSKDDYSSNHAQLTYVADDTSAVGVDTVQTLIMGTGVYGELPQLPWVFYGGGSPAPEATRSSYQRANGGPLGKPVAIGRGYGHHGWGTNSLVAFQSGLIAAFGANTSQGWASMKLPANKVPTAVAITDNNEFALVTVWDTNAQQGQVAVLALGAQGYTDNPSAEYWGNWRELYPGLRSLSPWSFIKLLGFVDLPGMDEPTEISASTDLPATYADGGWLVSPDGKDGRYTPAQLSLSNETNRQSFITGPNKDRYSKAGFAVVISKAENKAIFLDLKPLFAKVQSMYFGSLDDFKKTQNVGQAADQWPYSFDVDGSYKPSVIKTVDFAKRPSAVRTSLVPGVNQAYIAIEDGTLTIYSVGGYGTSAGGQPSDVQQVGSVQVGRNPTSIAYAKSHGWGTPDYLKDTLIVTSRGERKIEWVTLSGNSGNVTRTLRDSRLKDPIWAEDNDNHGTESYLLTVADYSGKQIMNYRYGPIIYHTNGGDRFDMGPDGKAEFEFGGAYKVKGKPFQVSGANVP